MKKILLLLMLLVILAACSKAPERSNVMGKVDLTDRLVSCTIFYDHTECQLNDGTIYYAMQNKINAVTKWDKSAWKENQ